MYTQIIFVFKINTTLWCTINGLEFAVFYMVYGVESCLSFFHKQLYSCSWYSSFLFLAFESSTKQWFVVIHVLVYGDGSNCLSGGPTHLMNIKDEGFFMVNDDRIGVARIFIWLKPLSQSAEETTNVFRVFLRGAN